MAGKWTFERHRGKLTTFRVIALDALRTALPDVSFDDHASVLNPLNASSGIDQRLLGRYAANAEALIAAAQPDELKPIGNTSTLWAELRWAARAEAVEHLDDLLLRRTRIGLLLPEGGKKYLPRIRAICKSELNWDEKRWQREINRYNELWAKYYSLPPRDTIPDWHELIPAETPIEAPSKWRYVLLGLSVVLLVLMLIRISRRTAESV